MPDYTASYEGGTWRRRSDGGTFEVIADLHHEQGMGNRPLRLRNLTTGREFASTPEGLHRKYTPRAAPPTDGEPELRGFLLDRVADRAHRRAATTELGRELTLAVGRDVHALRSIGLTSAEIARRTGLPLSTLNDYANAAVATDTVVSSSLDLGVPAPVKRVGASELVKAVAAAGPVVEIIAAGPDAGDVRAVLALSRLSPARFVLPNGKIDPPHMLMRLQDGRWLSASSSVNVGYSGAGPLTGQQMLETVGVDPDLAVAVTHERVAHVTQVHTQQPLWNPLTPNDYCIGVPQVVPGHEESLDLFRARIPLHSEGLMLWLDWLDRPNLPEWARGDRRGTVFTSAEAARDAGFSSETSAQRHARRAGILTGSPVITYPVVIEQGQLQLWLSAPPDPDPSVWVARDFRGPLHRAGLLDEDVVARDDASALRKFFSRRGSRPTRVMLGAAHAHPPIPEAAL